MASRLYSGRRRRFMDRMKDGVAIFQSAPTASRNGDVEHPYRQDSDFFYLTGFEEPGAIAVLSRSGRKRTFTLFVQPNDPEMEVWTGRKAGMDGAVEKYGANEAYARTEFAERLPGILTNRDRLYVRFGKDTDFDGTVTRAIEALKAEARKGVFGPWELIDPRRILWDMRLCKDPQEIKALEKACEITKAAFGSAMRAVRPGMGEWELAAVVEFEFRRRGSPRIGFETICASGANATTLHYISNDSRIGADYLVLIDAGAEYQMMTADISRTFPASGRFSEPGLTVYKWVLEAQKAAIAAVRPGVTYREVHETALNVLCRGLKSMGVLKGSVAKIIEKGAYQPFFMHRIGHWLGSDVHDVGAYFDGSKSIRLRPGAVITIEPGLYFPVSDKSPEHLRGIGVRIEDDVLVTSKGNRVLTEGLPKEPAEIEKWMAGPDSWWDGLKPVSIKRG
ncbi:MAG: M24 family metallopeptidase [Deltaproteobacteria bacterium]|nr:M24 family metallopeptidase [Deltaproteobacteria bacterium]